MVIGNAQELVTPASVKHCLCLRVIKHGATLTMVIRPICSQVETMEFRGTLELL